MDNKIDNGEILGQVIIPTPPSPTIYKVIKLTKDIGGNLMVKVVRQIITNSITIRSNNTKKGSYFSWPTVGDIKAFKKKGGKLI